MRNEILFGAAYYAEYMPYDRVDQDLQMMKQAGMNVIRIAESTWSTLEPVDGVFDFSYIDQVLDAAVQHEMYVIIGMPTYAVPSWLAKKEPKIMVTTKEGQALYGPRQLMDIVHPAFRVHAERVMRKLLEHTADHPNVIGFQIDNETKHYGTFSSIAQSMFVEYLKKTFHTTEAFNKAFGLSYWSNSIARWEDFPDISGCINGGLFCEYEKFRRSLAADYLGWESQIVFEYKREDQFITTNFDFEWRTFGAGIAPDGYSYGVQPDMNHYEASKHLTIVGTDVYHPTQDALTGAEIAFGGDSIRSLKHKNYLMLECQAQAFKYWTPYPGQLRLHAYSHLASGADGVMYWNWHSIHNGFETYWRGLLSHDLDTNPTYEEACRFGAEWQRIGHKLLHLKKHNRVALVTDTHSLHALRWFPIDRDLSYNDVVRWMYDSLYELNLECDVVDVHALDVKEYQMIITPALYSADENLIQKMEQFVKNGGVLVSSFRSFVADEHLSVYHDTLPHGLHDCFGMSYNQFSIPGNTTLQGKQVSYFMEFLKPDAAKVLEKYEHKYWGIYAAVTENTYGDGKAYYVGCYTDKDTLKEVYRQAARYAEVESEFPDVHWPVIVRSGVSQEGHNLHYVFNYSENERSVICPYEAVYEVLSGTRYEYGEEILLGDWNVAILEEIRKEDAK